MQKGFMLVNTTLGKGKENSVAKAIRLLEGVKEVHVVFGVYDIVVKVEAESMDDLKQRMLTIDRVVDVASTLKMIIVNP